MLSRRTQIHRLIKETLRVTIREWDAITRRENILRHSLSDDESRLRGVKLTDLILNNNKVKFINGYVEIELLHDYSIGSTARSFRRGKLVNVVFNSNNDKVNDWTQVKGTISQVNANIIKVQVEEIGSNFLLPHLSGKNADICIVDLHERSTIEIIEKSIKSLKELLKHGKNINDKIGDELIKESAEDLVPKTSFHQQSRESPLLKDHDLSPDKSQALELINQKHPLTIIHGPPGTGKTTTLAAAILSEVSLGQKVLATAPSHAAVDALAVAIIKGWNEDILGIQTHKMLRLGNALRLRDDRVAQFLPRHFNIQYILDDLEQVRTDLLQGTKGKKILLAEESKLNQKRKKTLAREETDQIKDKQIVVCTCLAAMKLPKKVLKEFNLICIDEAAFAADWLTLPLALCGIPRLILSGDHYQLPPVTESNQSISSLMERLAYKVPTSTLNKQFRSNSLLSEWSSQYFYNGNLEAHPSVANITLNDLVKESMDEILKTPLLFLDTSGLDFRENQDSHNESTSYINRNEANVVEMVIKSYLEKGIQAQDIGIISPYWSQVAIIRGKLRHWPLLEVSTVDGFQGCEKELIVVSLVRSNIYQRVGFLSESRRMNVTITRAKRSCVVIGDISTIQKDPALGNFVDFCRENNCIVQVKNYIKKQ